MTFYKNQILFGAGRRFEPDQKECEILMKKIISRNARMSRIEIDLPIQMESQDELYSATLNHNKNTVSTDIDQI